MANPITIRVLEDGEAAALDKISPEVFDHAVRPELSAEFLADPRHHIAVAADGETVVGFASAVHYVHPDKPAELWINEVGVAKPYRGKQIAQQLIRMLFAYARQLGIDEAWVLTEEDNTAARGLYASVGGREAPAVYVTFDLTSGL